jgi:hypothetical protein
MHDKIRLNDEQWKKLSGLAPIPGRQDRTLTMEAPRVPNRLTSYGLVAVDRNGLEYLTDRGMERLSQGR